MYTAVQPLWNCCKKVSEIRATRWLLWHSDFTKSNFGRGLPRTPLGELTTIPRTPSRLGRGYPSPFPTPLTPSAGVSLSTPSAIRRRGSVSSAPWNGHRSGAGSPKPNFWICLWFLLAFHSNVVPTVHHFWGIRRYWSKIAYYEKSVYPYSIWRPRWGWPRWNFVEIFGIR